MNEFWQKSKIVAGIITKRELSGPLWATVSIVDACNYRCIMCWEHSSEVEGWGADKLYREYHANKINKATAMDYGMYQSLVESLASVGTRRLGLHGICEPLMYNQIVDAVAFAKSMGMKVSISSNGALLSHDLIKDLVEVGLDEINISINAGSREEYGQVHPKQDEIRFDQIVENLIWMKEYKATKGKQWPLVSLSNVVSNINSHRGLEMMEVGIKVGAYSVTYRPISTFTNVKQFALNQEDLDTLHDSFNRVRALANIHGISTNIEEFDQLIALRSSNHIPAPCFVGGWLSTMIMANGDVIYCCNSREVIGNLGVASFKSIWFSSERCKLNNIALRIHKTQKPLPKSRCIDCELALLNMKLYGKFWPLWGKVVLFSG